MKPITEKGIDTIADKLLDISPEPVTREDWIDFAWLGDPPDPWTAEDEEQLPNQLRINPSK